MCKCTLYKKLLKGISMIQFINFTSNPTNPAEQNSEQKWYWLKSICNIISEVSRGRLDKNKMLLGCSGTG